HACRGLLHCPGGVIASPLQWNQCFVERRHLLLPTGSCEQRRKLSYDPLLPRMCQFFSLQFAATLSHYRVIHSDRTGWDSGRRCVLRRGFLAPLPDARALAQILAKRWASLT